ncbi:prepilin peptidase [Vibrio sp. ZSDZ65]|uniref:Prepilin peptidase n=1 Tax=Vibrio qingdaonensis TaxID=2829491 RepID=A0A9X3HUZ3_9VIBR|nr:prepilin peptidase [Vibrio qingdaonensis]MCW8344693.1 prepilin peptidase [Vibrio qingdaonensis]
MALTCFFVSIFDVKNRRIENKILFGFLAIQLVCLGFENSHVDSMLVVLFIGLIIFRFGWIAAGDVKYAGVLSLSIPMAMLYEAMLFTAYSGGVLVLCYYVKHRMTPGSQIQDVTLPYGVAISVGFFLTIASHQLQSQQLL